MPINNPGINVYDEGALVLAGAPAINFVGAGVTATNVAGVATATIPGGGGGGGALVMLDDWLAPGTTNTKTFSAIPGTYKDLIIVCSGQSVAGGWTDTLKMTWNAIASNYCWVREDRSGSSALSFDTSLTVGNFNTTAGDYPSTFDIEITRYALNALLFRTFLAQSFFQNGSNNGSALFPQRSAGGLLNTIAPITSVTLSLASNFAADSRITLYGRG